MIHQNRLLQTMLTCICMQNLIKIYHVVQKLWAFSLTDHGWSKITNSILNWKYQIKVINNNNILKIWYRNFARPTGVHYHHYVSLSIDLIAFHTIPSGTGYWLINFHHGPCTLHSVDFISFTPLPRIVEIKLFIFQYYGYEVWHQIIQIGTRI